jgi:hypothetical protein
MGTIDLSVYDLKTAMEIMNAMDSGVSAEKALTDINMANISPYFPYIKQKDGFQALRDAELFPVKVMTYLLDLPDAGRGYEPPDNNNFPRCRFWKYLFWDDGAPLLQPLPDRDEKRRVLYDPEKPNDPPDAERGYRLFSQEMWGMPQGERQTTVRVSLGRSIPRDNFHTEMAVRFVIMTSPFLEPLHIGMGRIDGLWQSVVEALHGVHIDGCGTVYFNRANHPDCGVSEVVTDGAHNLGRVLTMGITWIG